MLLKYGYKEAESLCNITFLCDKNWHKGNWDISLVFNVYYIYLICL